MTACGESDDAYTIRIYIPLFGPPPNRKERLLRVLNWPDGFIRHRQIAGQAILHYEGGETVVLEKLRD